MVNFPFFLTSVMPIFARASRAFEHSDFFRSIDFAIESAMPVFGIAFTDLAFMAFMAFMAFIAAFFFITFMAFMVFMAFTALAMMNKRRWAAGYV